MGWLEVRVALERALEGHRNGGRTREGGENAGGRSVLGAGTRGPFVPRV